MNKTQNKLIGICLTLTSAIACLVAAQPARAAEPVYSGKALSEWLLALHANLSDKELDTATHQNVEPAKLLEQKENYAREAIRQMGTNGLPTLLDLVSVGEGNRRSVARRIKSQDIREALRASKPEFREAIRGMAVDGFAILGTNAEPAIPQLTKLLHENPECRGEVASVLAQIGPQGFAVLTNAMNDEDLVGVLVLAIGQKGGGDVQTVTRILITALKSPNPIIRGNAAECLSGKDATFAVPALIPLLGDSEDYAWRAAAISLGSFGPTAKSAVPKLSSLYTNHPDVFVMRALGDIDREAAGQVEAFLVNSGPLNGARFCYTRTKLTNGLELIAGGYLHTEIPTATNRYLSSAELLDPKTGKWTETGGMHAARYDHKATLLSDGKVLVEGGYGSHPPNVARQGLSSKEVYDPATGTWTVVTNK